MQKHLNLIFCSLVVFLSFSLSAQKGAKGTLFIIGGGTRSDALMKQMVEAAALRPGDYAVVLPMASGVPEEGYALIAKQVGKHTATPVRNFDFSRQPVANKAWVDSLAGARLIYILGGDQNRFMKTVLGTPVYDAIHKAYQNGATIAGTSAGAAVMSRYMITGAQLRDTVYKETFDKLWENNIAFAEGLGLLEKTIIDQHFLKRSRHNRLLTALAEKPDHVCVGIDEGTAIIVRGNRATVAGESQVLRLANPKRAKATASGLITFENAEMGLFAAGDSFRIKP